MLVVFLFFLTVYFKVALGCAGSLGRRPSKRAENNRPAPQSVSNTDNLQSLGNGIEREARNSFAYWLLLVAEFPGQRLNLLRFLFRRLCGKALEWPRNPQQPGEIVSSRRSVLLPAAIKGLGLFLRTPKDLNLSKP